MKRMKYFKLILYILLATAFSSNAQQLKGKFFANLDRGRASILTFEKNNFTEGLPANLDGSFYGAGSYTLKGNSLILNYMTVPNQDTSSYAMAPHKGRVGYISISSIKAISLEDGYLLPINYGFTDANKEIVMLMTADTTAVRSFFVKNLQSGYLVIMMAGFHSIYIPVAKLRDKEISITAQLKPIVTRYIAPKKLSYKIKIISADEFILTNGKEQMWYKRKYDIIPPRPRGD